MQRTLVTLLLVFTCSQRALAQAPVEERERVRSAQGDGDRVGRVGAEVGLSFAGMVLFAGVGALLGWAAAEASPDPPCMAWCLHLSPGVEIGLGAGVGGAVGFFLAPAAVAWAGSLVNGRGDAGGAYLGQLFGLVLGASVFVGFWLIGVNTPDATPALLSTGLAFAALFAFAGPIVGYEVFDAIARSHVVPAVNVSSHGASVGVSGAF